MSEQAAPVDQWMNDDMHRFGALRESYAFEYSVLEQADKNKNTKLRVRDVRHLCLVLGTRPTLEHRRPLPARVHPILDRGGHPPGLRRLLEEGSVDQPAARLDGPNLNVAGFWDQEDPWGPWQIFRHAAEHDPTTRTSWWPARGITVSGTLQGRQHRAHRARRPRDGSRVPRNDRGPFFRYYLHGSGEKPVWRASTFQSGANRWRTYAAWPPPDAKPRACICTPTGRSRSTGPPPPRPHRRGVPRVRLGSGASRTLPAAPDLAHLPRRRLAHLGGAGPALR